MYAQSNVTQLDFLRVSQTDRGQIYLIPGFLFHLQGVACLGAAGHSYDRQD